jgi:hypothetical protein
VGPGFCVVLGRGKRSVARHFGRLEVGGFVEVSLAWFGFFDAVVCLQVGEVVSESGKCLGMAFLLLLSQVLRDLVENGGEGAEVVVHFYVEFE